MNTVWVLVVLMASQRSGMAMITTQPFNNLYACTQAAAAVVAAHNEIALSRVRTFCLNQETGQRMLP